MFSGFINVKYAPLAGDELISQLSGNFYVGGDEKKPLTGDEKAAFDRAMVFGYAILSSIGDPPLDEVEIEGKVVSLRPAAGGYGVDIDGGTVRTGEEDARETKTLAISSLPPGQQRALHSLAATLERFAWEDLRRRVGTSAPQREDGRPQVFISYRRGHEDFAESLANRLGVEGVVPWFDKWDVLAGDSLPGEIEKGLRDSIAFIPVLTGDYQEGAWATEELQSAIAKRMETDFKIIPVLLEECERPELIGHLRYVDFTAQDPDTFEAKIGELIDGIYGLTLNPFR